MLLYLCVLLHVWLLVLRQPGCVPISPCTALSPRSLLLDQGWAERKHPVLPSSHCKLSISHPTLIQPPHPSTPPHTNTTTPQPPTTPSLQLLETKIRKLEQLVRLKDAKIAALLGKLQAAGVQ